MNHLVYSKKLQVFLSLFFIVCGIYIVHFLWKIPQYDTEQSITFLQQQKNIAKKDFYHILEIMIPQHNTIPINLPTKKGEEISQKDSQEPQESEPQKPLIVYAILDDKVLLNEKWYHIGDTLYHNDTTLRIAKISTHTLTLIDSKNPKNSVIIDIVPKDDKLLLEMIDK